MKIEDRENEVYFSTLYKGDVFRIDGNVYMKTTPSAVAPSGIGHAICLRTGSSKHLPITMQVISLPDAVLTI